MVGESFFGDLHPAIGQGQSNKRRLDLDYNEDKKVGAGAGGQGILETSVNKLINRLIAVFIDFLVSSGFAPGEEKTAEVIIKLRDEAKQFQKAIKTEALKSLKEFVTRTELVKFKKALPLEGVVTRADFEAFKDAVLAEESRIREEVKIYISRSEFEKFKEGIRAVL